MMKILIVNSLYPPFVIGGAEVSTQKLAIELKNEGHDVYVLSTGERDSVEISDGVTHYQRHFKNIMSFWKFKHSSAGKRLIYKLIDFYNIRNKKVIIEVIKEINPDVIHTNTIYGITPAIWDCATECGIPVVQTLRDYYLMCPKANLMKKKEAACSSPNAVCKIFREFHRKKSLQVQAVTAPSAYTLKRFLDVGYFPKSVSTVIYNAIDYNQERFDCLAKLRMSKNENETHVIYIGSFIETKGIQVLLEAIEKCPSNVIFHFAGKGRLQPEIEEASKKCPNIIIEGFLSEDALNALLEKIDILVCPSVWAEPFGRVIIDGYKSCLPAIVTNCGGMPELVENGVTGLIIEPNDSDAIVNAITEMQQWKMTETRIGAMKQQLKKFSLEVQGRQFVELYRKVVENK